MLLIWLKARLIGCLEVSVSYHLQVLESVSLIDIPWHVWGVAARSIIREELLIQEMVHFPKANVLLHA